MPKSEVGGSPNTVARKGGGGGRYRQEREGSGGSGWVQEMKSLCLDLGSHNPLGLLSCCCWSVGLDLVALRFWQQLGKLGWLRRAEHRGVPGSVTMREFVALC
jgi:hypothetical protein